MTYRALYISARQRLAEAGIDSPGFDAALLAEYFLGLDRPALAVHGKEEAPAKAQEAFLRAVEERAGRRPLQYILGEWPFMGLTLKVGEGVLVPREDTAILVEALAKELAGVAAPKGLDLCAGSGAVALGLCSLLPETEAVCVEWDLRAMDYLQCNLERYPEYHLRAVRGDVLTEPERALSGGLDFIAANPPYIAAGALGGLQAEVRREPEAALNGGEDGLVFYGAIVGMWAPLLRAGGVLGVEIGEKQGERVAEMFRGAGLVGVRVQQDLAGLDRVVIGSQPAGCPCWQDA